MHHAIVQALPSAVVVAISPFAIVTVVLMLLTARGHVNAAAFTFGWIMGLAMVGVVWLSVASGVDSSEQAERGRWISVVLLVAGVLLLLLAIKQWRGRTRWGAGVAAPRWIYAFDTFSPGRAAGAGIVLSVSPKNLLLAFAGAAEIAQAGIPAHQQVVSYAVFILIATMGIGIPVLIRFAMRESSREPLEAVKNWMIRHNAVLVAGLSFIIGVKLIGEGIAGWSARL